MRKNERTNEEKKFHFVLNYYLTSFNKISLKITVVGRNWSGLRKHREAHFLLGTKKEKKFERTKEENYEYICLNNTKIKEDLNLQRVILYRILILFIVCYEWERERENDVEMRLRIIN